MSAPTLSAGEQAAIEAAIATIAAAQAERRRPVQVLTDDGPAIVALGVPEAIVAAATTAGFQFRVNEYWGPRGWGWELEITLTRDGVWSMTHHEGPETSRSLPWTKVPEMSP